MEHYRAIANLEYQFLETLDRYDIASVAALFAHGRLEITVPGHPEPFAGTGELEVAAALKRMLPPQTPGTFGRHVASNLIVDVDADARRASARMYTTLFLVRPDRPVHLVGLGRHADDLHLVDGEWTFSRKVITGEVQNSPPS